MTVPIPEVSVPAGEPVVNNTDPAPVVQTNNGNFVPVQPGTQFFTADDIARARQQEKDKLYPSIEQLQSQVRSLTEAQEAKLAEERRLREEAEAAAQRKAEEEMSLRDLINKKETEWNQRLQQIEADREAERALLEKERQFQALEAYKVRRVNEERDSIHPDLIDLVTGNSEDEVEASIAGLKDRSARILEGVQQVLGNQRPAPGARVTAPPAGPLDTQPGNRPYTPEDLQAMSMEEYAKNRQRFIGGNATNRGLFS